MKMKLLSRKFKNGFRRGKDVWNRGQVFIEYLLMTVMLLFLFTGLYRVLQTQLKMLFSKAGKAILFAYF